MTRRIALTIEYDGTGFNGWQLQASGRTVQGVLEEAIFKATGAHSRVHGASRTDAGVHAEGQAAHFDTDSRLPPWQVLKALNYYLPRDVAVLEAKDVPPEFHARFSATGKLYRYRVLLSPVRRPLLEGSCLREGRPLDLGAMQACAGCVKGEHDFASFASEPERVHTTVRTVTRSEWSREGEELRYYVEANGFLYKMVRTLVGTMLEAGLGKLTVADFERVMDERDRRAAGPCAPAKGLTLMAVRYRQISDTEARKTP